MTEQVQEEWEKLHVAGYCNQLLGKWDQARLYYERSLTCKPDYAPARLALAQLRMMQSNFHEGRELYEARFAARNETDWRALPMPRWRGESVTGKHLHLWVEQGFGDVIMYAAFLPRLLAQRPAHITISMFPKMMRFFARSFPEVTIESLEDIGAYALSPVILDTFPHMLKLAQLAGASIDLEPMRRDYEKARQRGNPDYSAPMGDLMVYGLPGFIPAQHQASYMMADPQRMADTRHYLQRFGPGRKIGISWHTTNIQSGSVRNIPLEEWIPLLRLPDCHFISLQHHVSAQAIEDFNRQHSCHIIADRNFDAIGDTEGLVALTACMDKVITIDNSNAHLAGALGVPTTLLLPKGCDFRWPVVGNGTLWYRSVTVERQKKSMEWQPVIEHMVADLRLGAVLKAGKIY